MGRHRHAVTVRADGLAAVLGRLLNDPRVLGAVLVDVDSGMVLDACAPGSGADARGPGAGAGIGGLDPELVGAGYSELGRVAVALPGRTGPGTTDDEVLVSLGPTRHHLLRAVPDPHGDRLVLAVAVDGSRRFADRVRRKLRDVPVDALTAGPTVVRRPGTGGWAAPSPGVQPLPRHHPAPGARSGALAGAGRAPVGPEPTGGSYAGTRPDHRPPYGAPPVRMNPRPGPPPGPSAHPPSGPLPNHPPNPQPYPLPDDLFDPSPSGPAAPGGPGGGARPPAPRPHERLPPGLPPAVPGWFPAHPAPTARPGTRAPAGAGPGPVAAEPVAAGAPSTAAPSLFTPGADLRTTAPDRDAHLGYGPGYGPGFGAGFDDPVHPPAEHPVDHSVDHSVGHGHGDPSASSDRGARTRTPEESPSDDPRPPAPPSALPPGRSG